jgi:predicted membrane protein
MIARYIFFAVLIYIVYILLKYILKIIVNISKPLSTKQAPKSKKSSRFDPDQIEDADFEEIKKP